MTNSADIPAHLLRELEFKKRFEDFEASLATGMSQNQQFQQDCKEDWRASGLQDVGQSFRLGLARVLQLPGILSSMFRHASQMQYATDVVRLRETGGLVTPPFFLEAHKFSHDELEALRQTEQRITPKIQEAWRDVMDGKGNVIPWGFNSLPHRTLAGMVANVPIEKQHAALRSFYESLVILGWATFETLAEDLWEAAVNALPSKLGSGNIPLDLARLHKFQIADKIGTITKRVDHRSFRTLADIINEYEKLFSKQNGGILAVLENPELRYSAALRNLLIHKSGKIDKEFQDQVSGVPDAYKGTIGEQFPLTGKIARARSEAALDAALRLLKAAHAWLIGHPD